MKTKIRKLGRAGYAAIALALAAASLLPALAGEAFAYGQVTSRSIQMSDSSPSGSSVSYVVSFTETATSAVKSVDVDFCTDSPIYGDSCTAPTGLDASGASLSAQTGTSGWTLTASTAHLVIAGATANSATSMSFTLDGITNPSTTGTFYARIYTYAAQSNDYTSVTNPGTVYDFGGIALSTASVITVTAKVQEQLTFCLYTNANCGAGGTAVTLGDNHGVLSSAGPFVDKSTKYDISTNAQGGAVVKFKGSTLTSGSNTITAMGASATGSVSGSSQFGLCSYKSSGSTLTITSPYDNASCSTTAQTAGTGTTGGDGGASFALDTNATDGTGSTYGDQLASATAGNTNVGIIAFLGNISTAQQAGVYTSNMTFIATGTY